MFANYLLNIDIFSTFRIAGMERCWLRFYTADDAWVPTPLEQGQSLLDQERQRAEQERQRAERLAAQLRALGIEPQE